MIEITDTTTLERHIRGTIPLARAMDLAVADYDGTRLVLAAPLAPNVNDKGCAFGGSMISLLTLAGWGLITLKLGAAGLDADVYVQDSAISYLSPVWDEILAEAGAAPEESWDLFLTTLRERGKARIAIEAEVTVAEGGQVAARFSARFVAKTSAAKTTVV